MCLPHIIIADIYPCLILIMFRQICYRLNAFQEVGYCAFQFGEAVFYVIESFVDVGYFLVYS